MPERTIGAREFRELVGTYCESLERKIERDWKELGQARRGQLKNELEEYSDYLRKFKEDRYKLGEGDWGFLTGVRKLIIEEIDYLAGHERQYYKTARDKLGEILEGHFRGAI